MPMELELSYANLSIPCAIANLEALKTELQPKLEHYKSLVVTEDGIKAAKDDKAALNKLKKAVSEQRIAVKKQCLTPYEALEKECKELEKLIDEPINAIDSQIKAFDEKERDEKLLKLKTAFYKTDHPDWLDLSAVIPEKWANKTEKLEKLIEEMNRAVDTINREYDEIQKMYQNFPLLTAITDQYKRTRDKADTLAYAVMLEKQYEADQERMKKEQEAAKRDTTENANICPPASSGEVILETPQTADNVDSGANQSEPISEKTITGTFRVTCTKQQLISLRDFMKENNINFEVVKGEHNGSK